MAATDMTADHRPMFVGSSWQRVVVGAALAGLVALVIAADTILPDGWPARASHLRLAVVSDYISAPPDGRTLVALDPATLAERDQRVGFLLGPYGWALSGDGSTWASVERTLDADGNPVPGTVTVVIRDGPTGADRLRFQPPGLVCCPLLTHDGSRLIIMRLDHDAPEGPHYQRFTLETTGDRRLTGWRLVDVNGMAVPMRLSGWQVIDTATGQVLSTATPPAPAGEVWWTWLDPAGWLLYRLIAGSTTATAPWPPLRLVAYDVGIGLEVGRLDLPAVQIWQMGIGLAPDGRRLVLADAHAEALTLVDVARLAIERTLHLTRPEDRRDRPGEEERDEAWRPVFAPDGRQLYIIRVTVRSPPRGPALALVDLQRGRLVVDGLAGEHIAQVLPAPDGRSLYVLGPTVAAGRRSPLRLRRLDARTLAPLAERAFDGPRTVLLWLDGRAASPVDRDAATGATGTAASGAPVEVALRVGPLLKDTMLHPLTVMESRSARPRVAEQARGRGRDAAR